MTRFADDLFNDLMREHGSALERVNVPKARQRHLTARPVLATAGAGGLAVAAAAGTLVATSAGSPAYAVTTHPNGTVTLAVYQSSGIAGANSKLHDLGDRVVVVPVQPGCPSIVSLPAPAVRRATNISVELSTSGDGSVTVNAQGIPAGDILVLGLSTIDGRYQFSTQGPRSGTGQPVGVASKMTSGPAPNCVSIPAGWQHPVADGSTPGSHSADGPGRAPTTESDGSPGSTPASQSAGGPGSTPVTHSDGGAVSNS